jgi:hypothetical protein
MSGAQIKESKIHDNLNRDKMFKEAWWLQYCCCGGRAIGDIGNPYFGEESRMLCLHKQAECTDVGGPFCSGLSVMCCFTQQCAFPKIDGSPTCVCCNKKLAGGDTGSWKPALFEFTPGFDDQFWLYYIFCGGISVHGFQKGGRPLFGTMRKQLCIKEAVQCVSPVQEGVFCSGLGTCLCFWNQMQIPPAEGNPCIACCGWKKNKGEEPSTKPSPMSYGKPGQEEMS